MSQYFSDRKSCGRYLFSLLSVAASLAAVQACSSEAADADSEWDTRSEEALLQATEQDEGAVEEREIGSLQQAATAPVCNPGQTRCSGNTPQICRADRTGFRNLGACSGIVFTSCQNSSVVQRSCDDGKVCTSQRCIAPSGSNPGGCSVSALPAGTICSDPRSGAGVCSGASAACVETCNVTADCINPSAVCSRNSCVVIR
jgi:hypothetical protein